MPQTLNSLDSASLRLEVARLRAERQALLRLAAAACMLIHDLDGDTLETFESAELLADCLRRMPEDVVYEAMRLCRVEG
ncbi:MAG: hypothetical protein AB7U30_02135 [Sulfuricellaceae bacterium]|jgi:hypothetical protein